MSSEYLFSRDGANYYCDSNINYKRQGFKVINSAIKSIRKSGH
jgi:hypothetical protein